MVKTDTAASLKLLHCWLRNWQGDCTKGVYHGLGQGGGIGATIESAVRWLCFAIENGHYYRPDFTPWFVQVNNCSLSANSVDCYFQPLSTCGFPASSVTPCSSGEALSALLPKSGIDTCYIAKALKKPLQWLQGALYDFFLQYDVPGGIEARVRSRVEQILEQRKDGEALLSIHVRGGKPDSKRISANISHYIEAADLVAAQLLAATNKTVKWVFLSSDSQDSAIGTAESLARTFPRQWQYLLLPHLTLAPAIAAAKSKLVEVQHVMESASLKRSGLLPSPRELSIEYFADTEIHAGSDAFIGSTSNMYTLATGLRVARGNDNFRNHSCFLHLQVSPPSFHCEGANDPIVRNEWIHHSYGGYSGGTCFF